MWVVLGAGALLTVEGVVRRHGLQVVGPPRSSRRAVLVSVAVLVQWRPVVGGLGQEGGYVFVAVGRVDGGRWLVGEGCVRGGVAVLPTQRLG